MQSKLRQKCTYNTRLKKTRVFEKKKPDVADFPGFIGFIEGFLDDHC